jgi:Methyltransferase domain
MSRAGTFGDLDAALIDSPLMIGLPRFRASRGRSKYTIANANTEVASHLRQASATDLPFADGTFSLAVSFDLLEHLVEPCARRALVESARVSRHQLHQANTGRLEEWRFDGDSSHCSKYSLDQWQAMAAELGLARTVICEPDRRLPFLQGVAR